MSSSLDQAPLLLRLLLRRSSSVARRSSCRRKAYHRLGLRPTSRIQNTSASPLLRLLCCQSPYPRASVFVLFLLLQASSSSSYGRDVVAGSWRRGRRGRLPAVCGRGPRRAFRALADRANSSPESIFFSLFLSLYSGDKSP